MGGRGAYFSGASARYESRQFDAISTANGGRIKVLKIRPNVPNLHFPIYSNTPNTTYFVVDERDNDRIATVTMYRNHRLVESIDLTDTRGIHWHKWETIRSQNGEYIRKGKVNGEPDFFDLKERHQKLIQYVRAWEASRI